MEIYTDKLGWIAAILFFVCFCYFILKRFVISGFKIKIKLRQVLNLHCYLGIIGTIIAIFHVGKNIVFIQLSAGFICFFSMILLCISGIAIKWFKKISPASRKAWRFIHIGLTAVFVTALLLHIVLYHFIIG